eukprot:606212-Pyramimonas_sp.AAC.1
MLIVKPGWVTHGNGIYSIDLSNTRVVTGGGDMKVRVWSLQPMLADDEVGSSSNQLLATLSDHFGVVHVVRFSPDGKYIASGSDDRLCIVYRLDPNGVIKQTFGSTDLPPVECWKVRTYMRVQFFRFCKAVVNKEVFADSKPFTHANEMT